VPAAPPIKYVLGYRSRTPTPTLTLNPNPNPMTDFNPNHNSIKLTKNKTTPELNSTWSYI